MTYRSLAEVIVQQLPIPPFTYRSTSSGIEQLTRFYLLPIVNDTVDEITRGIFSVHGQVGTSAFLFSYDDRRYICPKQGGLTLLSIHNKYDFLQLPLQKTEFTINLEKDGKPLPGSPFPVMGIAGSSGILPLTLISKVQERWECIQGIYKAENNLYSCYLSNEAEEFAAFVEEFLSRMDQPSAEASSISLSFPAVHTSRKSAVDQEVDCTDPQSVVRYLDDYVIGQEEAKKDVAVAVSSLMMRKATGDETLPKMNTMLIGPTGVGKTYMMKILARKAGIPFAFTKLVGRSAEGYYGQNVSKVFDQIHLQAKGKEEDEEAPYGIVFLDEIDKIVYGGVGGKFSFGEQMQNELIGWVEEDHLSRALGEGNSRTAYQLNTKNLLFVVAGAFQGRGKQHDGLSEIIASRLAGGRQIGFGAAHPQRAEKDSLLHQVQPEDLMSWGFLPELVGRFPVVSTLDRLTEEQRVRILTEAKDSTLAGHVRLLTAQGYTIKDPTLLAQLIVSRCPAETGARGLASVCSQLFRDVLFDPSAFADNNKNICIDRLTGALPASAAVAVSEM
ncbi:AAA family ATPase [Candidatus Woesearchaeota archaeon]|nr:AAA family ATPase [Candidatus Woesearchaeota archaeon]